MASAARTRWSRRATQPYPFRPRRARGEGRAQLADKLSGIGLHPFHLPLGILLDQKADGSPTADQRLHALQLFRRLSLPFEWQGGMRR